MTAPAHGEGKTFRLLLEYDGTEFAGFQLQGKGERTVQAVLEDAVAQLAGTGALYRIHGAGRTDAGVHAMGQVAHFAAGSEWRVPAGKLAVALNGLLPHDLTVREAREAEPGFHSRYSATARLYRYAVLNRPMPSAMLSRYTHHMRDPLDLNAMRAAAIELTGHHDFAAFGRAGKPGRSTVRRVSHVMVRAWGPSCVLITVRGNAFLRQMVRAFVGTLIVAGQGRITLDDVRAIRESRDRILCPPIAPARGLCLVRVEYDGTRRRYFDTPPFNEQDYEDDDEEEETGVNGTTGGS